MVGALRSALGSGHLRSTMCVLGALAIQAPLLVACQGSSSPATSTSPLVIATPAIDTTYDPAVFGGVGADWDQNSVASPLLRYTQPKGTNPLSSTDLIGELASSWKQNSDGSYTFTLRKAKSPYGNTVTSQDVLWTFQRWLAIAPVHQFLLKIANVDFANPIQVLTDQTFTVRLTKPNTLVLPLLTYYALTILDSTEVKKHTTSDDPWGKTWLTTNSATYGPYQLQSFVPGSTVKLTANPNYWNAGSGVPAIKTVVFDAVSDAGARLSLAATGSVDFITDLNWPQVKELKSGQQSVLKVDPVPSPWVTWMFTYNLAKPFDDKRVRQAVSLAIDRNALIQTAYAGFGKPERSLIQSTIPQPALPSGADKYTQYDPQAAKALLAQAGYPNGGVSFTLSYNSQGQPNGADLATFIQSQLAAVGITMTINPVGSPSEFTSNFFGHKYQATFGRLTSLVNDAAYWVRLEFSSLGNKVSGYFGNQRLDELVGLLINTSSPTPSQSDGYVQEMQTILGADLPDVPLVEEVENWAYKTNVIGVWPNAQGTAYVQDFKRQ